MTLEPCIQTSFQLSPYNINALCILFKDITQCQVLLEGEKDVSDGHCPHGVNGLRCRKAVRRREIHRKAMAPCFGHSQREVPGLVPKEAV